MLLPSRWMMAPTLRVVAVRANPFSSSHLIYPTNENHPLVPMRQSGTLAASVRRLLWADAMVEGDMSFLRRLDPLARLFHGRSAAPNLISLESQRHAIVLSSGTSGAPAKFLQNLLTVDTSSLVDAPRPSNGRAMYSHMLNSKGRFAHDVVVFGLGHEAAGMGAGGKAAGDVLVLDVARESKDALVRLLRMYSMRSDVKIEDGSDSFVVCASLNGDMEGGSFAAFCEDPRVPSLGYRGILRRDGDVGASSGGDSFLEGLPRSDEDVRASYTKLRLSLGVAEGPREIPAGSVSLEYNLDGLNGISFNKGCYIGQELMARTHYQGQIRKRLVPFRVEGDGVAEYGEAVCDAEGQPVGVVRADSVDGYGIAMVRLGKAFGSDAGGLRIGSGRAIEAYVPAWWPKAWVETA